MKTHQNVCVQDSRRLGLQIVPVSVCIRVAVCQFLVQCSAAGLRVVQSHIHARSTLSHQRNPAWKSRQLVNIRQNAHSAHTLECGSSKIWQEVARKQLLSIFFNNDEARVCGLSPWWAQRELPPHSTLPRLREAFNLLQLVALCYTLQFRFTYHSHHQPRFFLFL